LRGLAATFTEHEQNGGVVPTIRGIAAFPGVLAPQAAHDSYLEATATSRLDEIAERKAAPVEIRQEDHLSTLLIGIFKRPILLASFGTTQTKSITVQNVRYRGRTGKLLLTLMLSGFDR
jgi:hypothetical protein